MRSDTSAKPEARSRLAAMEDRYPPAQDRTTPPAPTSGERDVHAVLDAAQLPLSRAAHVQQHQAGDGGARVGELAGGQAAGGAGGLRVLDEGGLRLVEGPDDGVQAHPGQAQPGVAGAARVAYDDDVAADD